MIVSPVQTHLIAISERDLLGIVDRYLTDLKPEAVVGVTSKIVAVCEGRVRPKDIPKDVLIKREAERYLPADDSPHGHLLTVKRNRVSPSAGIDESNADGNYIL